MDTLFITTACEGGVDTSKGTDEKGVFLGGYVYKIHLNVIGRMEWLVNL